jgi:NAD+ kinase
MRVAIYGKKVNRQNVAVFQQFLGLIDHYGWKPVLEKELKEQLAKKAGIGANADTFASSEDFRTGIDIAFSIGGDGTFLKMVSFIRDSKVPILGINTGRLGFLANIGSDVLEESMEMVRKNQFEYQLRSLLRVETERELFGTENVALNELTVHKKDTSSMVTVNAYLDDKFLNAYWADGLIVSTPTGSTAYSLSCGGPIITPGCQVHILTPIAPHNLNVRPMVVPDSMTMKLSVEGRERNYLISLDGTSKSLRQGEEVIISKAEYMINVIKFEDNNFLDTIRNKMLWGIDRRN